MEDLINEMKLQPHLQGVAGN
jgi:hypothetical protein